MVVDSSALVAILLGEPEGDALALALPFAAEARFEPAEADLVRTAFDAWQGFGHGRRPVGLNFADRLAGGRRSPRSTKLLSLCPNISSARS